MRKECLGSLECWSRGCREVLDPEFLYTLNFGAGTRSLGFVFSYLPPQFISLQSQATCLDPSNRPQAPRESQEEDPGTPANTPDPLSQSFTPKQLEKGGSPGSFRLQSLPTPYPTPPTPRTMLIYFSRTVLILMDNLKQILELCMHSSRCQDTRSQIFVVPRGA